MFFHIVKTWTHPMVNVDHMRTCTEENRDPALLEPNEHRIPSGRYDCYKSRFLAGRTSQNRVFSSQLQRDFEACHWSGNFGKFTGYLNQKIASRSLP